MKYQFNIASASVLAMVIASSAFAQSTLTGVDGVNERIDDIQTAAQEDIDSQKDAERFGPNEVAQGWRGSLAFSASATSGSTDTGEISLAARLSYGAGSWNHSFGLAGEYGRTGKTKTKEEFFGTYEANRYFTPEFYMFGLGSYQYNSFGTTEQDAFIGFGPGYRIVNSENAAWRVQAGPGVRFVKDNLGNTTTEASGILSSRVFFGLTDTMSITNDTDVLYSDLSTVATNDLGLNIKVSDSISTRFGYRTEYDSIAPSQYENKASVSLVVGF